MTNARKDVTHSVDGTEEVWRRSRNPLEASQPHAQEEFLWLLKKLKNWLLTFYIRMPYNVALHAKGQSL